MNPPITSATRTEEGTAIRIERYRPNEHAVLWDAFVERSMNGTAFHKQRFLEYHPAGRFLFEHLLFFKGPRLVAVLPGGRANNSEFESPLGASYGSFVIEDIGAQTALDIVEAFEAYVIRSGISKVSLTSAPVIYSPLLTQNLDFALLYKGYNYDRHYISHAIDLRNPGRPIDRFQPVARKHVRRISREHPEVTVSLLDQPNIEDGLAEFYPVLLANKAKYGVRPTHTLEELIHLNSLLPDLMRLFLVRHQGKVVAGSLLFCANKRVALIFYHMLLYEFAHLRPIYLLMDSVTSWAKENNFSFVDIGVSQDTSDENPMTPALSLIEFKEKFDSRGLLRSTLAKDYRH